MPLVDALLLVLALVPLPVTLLLVAEIAGGLRDTHDDDGPLSGEAPPFTVVVPAHDEESGIARTVRSLRADMRAGDRLLVVADNCTDATATLASDAGAEVLVRHDAIRRGKGYALEAGIAHPAVSATGWTLIVDADCLVAPGSLAALAGAAARSGRPVQGDYRLIAPEGAGLATRFRAFAIRVKNHIRLIGGGRLGIPCILTGSGMAFPRDILRNAPIGSGEIVEDLLLSVDLSLDGHEPLFCPQARITSPLPLDREAAARQRERWEAGFLSVARRFAGRLMVAGVVRRRRGLLLMGLDLAIPPLSLLVMMLGGVALVTIAAALAGASWVPAVIAIGQAVLFVVAIHACWRAAGRDLLSGWELLTLPMRTVAKLGFYLRLRQSRGRGWVRTARDAAGDDATSG